MDQSAARHLYVNLAVADVARARAFFEALGLTCDPNFSNDECACMALNPGAYAMLLSETFFRNFTKREPCDTSTHTEVMLALSCSSRAEVNAMLEAAEDNGGRDTGIVQDMGFMYGRGFYDPDGHHWEVVWMDTSKAPS